MQNSLLIGLGSAFLVWKAYKLGYFDDVKPSPPIIRQSREETLLRLVTMTIFLLLILKSTFMFFKGKLIETIDDVLKPFRSLNLDCCLSANVSNSDKKTSSETSCDDVNINVNEVMNEDETDHQTKDIKISSDSLGQNNVVVYKVITDKELDGDILDLEENDDTPKLTINKLNKPLKKNKKRNKKDNKKKIIIENSNEKINETKTKDNDEETKDNDVVLEDKKEE